MKNLSRKNFGTSIAFGFFFLFFATFAFVPSSVKAATPSDSSALKTEVAGAATKDDLRNIIEGANPSGKMISYNIQPWDGSGPIYVGQPTDKGVLWFKLVKYYKPSLANWSWKYYWQCVDNPHFYVEYDDSMVDGVSNYWTDGATVPDPGASFNWVWTFTPSWLNAGNWSDTGWQEWRDTNVPSGDTTNLDKIAGATSITGAMKEKTITDTIIELLSSVGGAIMGVVGWLLEHAINALLIVNVNQSSIIQGWAVVRNASNVLLVLVLLFIAFFNAIRFQIDYYNAKVLIPRLAIAAVMINFSFFVSRAIVDLGNVMTNYFASKVDWPNLFVPNTVAGFLSGGFAIAGIVLAAYLLGTFLALIAIVAVGILVAILLVRHALLYLLVVFSPLVFLATVLPFTRGLSSQWWNYMTRYAFMGVVITLILFVASAL